MPVVSDHRRWDELIPDTLGMIFAKLSLQERLTVIPEVCKSWSSAAEGPYGWQEINLNDWSREHEPHEIERMVEMLVTRSSGSLRKLSVYGLKSERVLNFIAENAGSLRNLRVPRSNMNDNAVEQIIGKLSKISILDLSYCMNISKNAIEIIGKNCRQLEGFCRNMHPTDTEGKLPEDAEAFAIASTMPKLKHLEIAYNLVSDKGVLEILSSCPNLEYLDLRGCWNVTLDNTYVSQKYPKLQVLGPLVFDSYYEMGDSSDISDSSDSEYVDSDMDDEYDYYDDATDDDLWYDERWIEQLEFRFYEGDVEDAEMYWPPAP